MPLNRVHEVLCIACQAPARTLYAYDERRCGYTGSTRRDDELVHVSCTNDEGNKDCGGGVHYDKYMQLRFEGRKRLRAGRAGQV